MTEVRATETHKAEAVVSFSWAEVSRILQAAAMEELPNSRPYFQILGAKDAVCKIEIRQRTAGSPSYHIDEWTACVRLEIDMGELK